MATNTRTVTKALAGEEDLMYGEGTAQQTRASGSVSVTKIRGFRPVNSLAELNGLNSTMFPKAALVENGSVIFYQHDGANYIHMIPVSKTETLSVNQSTFSAIGRKVVLLNIATAHTLTNIPDGVAGQEITLVSLTANSTVQNNADIVLTAGADYLIPINTGLKLVYTGSVWAQI